MVLEESTVIDMKIKREDRRRRIGVMVVGNVVRDFYVSRGRAYQGKARPHMKSDT